MTKLEYYDDQLCKIALESMSSGEPSFEREAKILKRLDQDDVRKDLTPGEVLLLMQKRLHCPNHYGVDQHGKIYFKSKIEKENKKIYLSPEITISPNLDSDLFDYLLRFHQTKHIVRDVGHLKELEPDYDKDCFRGRLGKDCEYYVGNGPIAVGVPLCSAGPTDYCPWYPKQEFGLTKLYWENLEAISEDVNWLVPNLLDASINWASYIMKNFLKPCGYWIYGVCVYGEEDEQNLFIVDEKFPETEAKFIHA